jgi:hypothetical protein
MPSDGRSVEKMNCTSFQSSPVFCQTQPSLANDSTGSLPLTSSTSWAR